MPGSHPGAHTLALESDTHQGAGPRRGRRPGPLCSPVWKVITEMSRLFSRGERAEFLGRAPFT